MEDGRQALAEGDTPLAASTLSSALALWRGPALADFAFEQFAQPEISRLEELRVAALEDRIEADLVLGRHETVVPELEALVRDHPYRERLRAQLMLALYRSGRQAESLDAYRSARRALVEQLGIEPGPRLQELEGAILRQDPVLELPVQRPAIGLRRGRFALALVGGAVLVTAVVAALGLRGEPRAPPSPVALQGNSVAVIDPVTNRVTGEIPIGGRPSGIAVGEGSVWVGNRDTDTLLQLDPDTQEVVSTIGLGVEPRQVAVGEGSVWILSMVAGLLLRVDPSTGDVVARIVLPLEGAYGAQLEVAEGAVWLALHAYAPVLIRVDADTNAVTVNRGRLTRSVAYGSGALWALEGIDEDVIVRINPQTSAALERVGLDRLGRLGGIAAGAGALWTANSDDETLWKIDPLLGRLVEGVPLGRRVRGVAVGEGGVWAVGADATVTRIDPKAGRLVKTIPLGVYPPGDSRTIAVGEGSVWVPTLSP